MVAPIYVDGYHTKKHPLYKIWEGMVARCHRKSCKEYRNYGGRGITSCARWRNSFAAFVKDMSPRPSKRHSLDRKNNNKGYSKANCRWATSREQTRNARYNHLMTANGKTQTMTDWCHEIGVPISTIKNRLLRGWTDEQALLTPVNKYSEKNSICPAGFTKKCA